MKQLYKNKYLKVAYHPLLPRKIADRLLQECETLDWKSDKKRSNITFANDGLVYKVTFRNNSIYRRTKPWSQFPLLEKIKRMVEKHTGQEYNFCAIMRYPHGGIVIKKHRDKEMGEDGVISGISVGSTRTIVFSPPHHLDKKPIHIDLEHGSLYNILPPTNDHWCHEIIESSTNKVRYSLTFRNMTKPLTEKDIPVYPKCKATLKTGARKGKMCGNNAKSGEFCGRHKNCH